jgi:hypothetical protein
MFLFGSHLKLFEAKNSPKEQKKSQPARQAAPLAGQVLTVDDKSSTNDRSDDNLYQL